MALPTRIIHSNQHVLANKSRQNIYMSMFEGMQMVIQPLLVGAIVCIKGVLVDDYSILDPYLLADIGINMVAKLISQEITSEFLVPMLGQSALFLDPVMQGTLTGVTKEYVIDQSSIASLGMISTKAPPLNHYTFESGFLEGAISGSISTGVTYFSLGA